MKKALITSRLSVPLCNVDGSGNVVPAFYTPAASHNICMNTLTNHKSLAGYDACNIRLTYCNWAMGISTNPTIYEQVNINPVTIRSALVLPNGKVAPLYFRGKRDGVMDGGAFIESDPLGVTIPQNSWFKTVTKILISDYTTQFWPLSYFPQSALGDSAAVNTVDFDWTLTPASFTPNATRGYGPSAITGEINDHCASVLIMGDSLALGFKDSGTADYEMGHIARALGNAFGHAFSAELGNAAYWEVLNYGSVQNNTKLACFARKFTDVIVQLGTNDVGAPSASLAQMETQFTAFVNNLAARNVRVHACTLPPNTTSTDDWTTTTHQTPQAHDSWRTGFNDFLRAVPAPLYSCFEVADAVETARNSGIWKANYTPDGVHMNATGYAAATAAIDTSQLT